MGDKQYFVDWICPSCGEKNSETVSGDSISEFTTPRKVICKGLKEQGFGCEREWLFQARMGLSASIKVSDG